MDTTDEEKIRARAYAIWEREGYPQGREHDHWIQARQELIAEKVIGEGASDEPAGEFAPFTAQTGTDEQEGAAPSAEAPVPKARTGRKTGARRTAASSVGEAALKRAVRKPKP